MHEYAVQEILRVVDGDTVDCRISLGFGLDATFRFRVAHIDTPEVYGQHAETAGKEASLFTSQWLALHPYLVVRTFKGSEATVGIGDGAFGRWLAAFVDPADGSDLASALTAAGLIKHR